jgi:hypothetical protein
MPEPIDLTADHFGLTETQATRRYFRKFARITGHLEKVAQVMEEENRVSNLDAGVILAYVKALAATFDALGDKYLMTGRGDGTAAGQLTMDRVESGFPVHRELLIMASDAQQADQHLNNMPTEPELKDTMVRQILGDLKVPTKLQFALSQRMYYQALKKGGLFWAHMDPQAVWIADIDRSRRRYLVHWAVYDSQVNLPQIYLLELEDSGRTGLPKDSARWPDVQRHLMAQSMAGLKLLTIAQGFDSDFADLHPKRLRRIYVGPMYSSVFTLQSGPLKDVLIDARSKEGDDWALAWTVETLESERFDMVKSGWFGQQQREIFKLDPYTGMESGVSRTDRALMIPERPYQVLAEKNPAGFRDVRKFVVSAQGRVLSYR